MNEICVSVIMPVYNTVEFLDDAIGSIIQQTFKDFELIIINDGSTDESLIKLLEWEKSDSRIRVFSQNNLGLSATRNKGLSYAKGEFIYFMDSDDYLNPDALGTCVNHAKTGHLDLVFFNADILGEMGESKKNYGFNYERKKTIPFVVTTGSECLRQLLNNNEFFAPVWMLFVRRNLIENRNLSFETGIIHEDELFTVCVFLLAQRVVYIPKQFFLRRVRENSIMTSNFTWFNISSYLKVAKKLKLFVEEYSSHKDLVDICLKRMLNAAIWKAHLLSYKERIKLFFIILRDWNEYVNKRTYAVLLVKKNRSR